MYKAVIFDFFGVIHRDPFHHWLKQNDLQKNAKAHEVVRLLDLGSIDLTEFYQRLSSLTGQPAKDTESAFGDMSFVDNAMVTFIKQLRDNYKIGLLSNSGGGYIGRIIEKYELAALFDVMVISSEVGLIKPDPAIFRHALEKLQVSASETAFIDDGPSNVEAAARLDIKSFLYEGDITELKRQMSKAGLAITE